MLTLLKESISFLLPSSPSERQPWSTATHTHTHNTRLLHNVFTPDFDLQARTGKEVGAGEKVGRLILGVFPLRRDERRWSEKGHHRQNVMYVCGARGSRHKSDVVGLLQEVTVYGKENVQSSDLTPRLY